MKRAHITKDERMLVITGMDFNKKTRGSKDSNIAIKLEPSYLIENEEVLFAAGYQRIPQTWRGRGRGRGGRSGRGGRGGFQRNERSEKNNERSSDNKNTDSVEKEYNNSPNRDYRATSTRGRGGGTVGRSMNPIGSNGSVLTCSACGSFRHLLSDCQHSWENLEKAHLCLLEDSVSETLGELNVEEFKDEMLRDSDEGDEEEVNVLFTGQIKSNIARLGLEAKNCMVVDSACSKTVCGKLWLKCYIDSLSDLLRSKVTFARGEKIYKFGGGVKLKSCALVTLPAFIGGIEVTIETDVVDSDIPLLWSTPDMKRAEVILNFKNDTAEIYGRLVDLHNTTSGHYCVPLSLTEMSVEDVLMTKLQGLSPSEVQKKLLHLHRQFAHPTVDKLVKLLKDAGVWEDEFTDILASIHETCTTCKEYAKVPPRPVVGLPMA